MEATSLDGLVERFLQEYVERHPVSATSLGIDGYDEELGDYSAEWFESRAGWEDRWIAAFEGVADDGLSVDERIDRDLALSYLRGGTFSGGSGVILRERETWRRSPDLYVGAGLGGVFALFLHRLRPDDELARAAASRLRQVPGVLAHARRNLDPALADRRIVERAVGQCRAGVTYARDLVPQEVPEGPLRTMLAEAGEEAARAYEEMAAFLQDLAARSTGTYALGEETYSRLLREKELLGLDARALRDRGRAAYDEIAARMTATAREHFGTDDWRAVMERLNADHPETPEEMRDLYDEWTQRARDFLIERRLVTLPEGEVCLVEPSPHFQRPVLAVASYSSPPAFKPSLTGHFFVPYPPDGTPPEEVRKRLQTNSRASIPSVSVHEAYPGHHWHLTWMQGNPRPLRRVFGTPYFSEGWALYAELMMDEHGFFQDPAHVMGFLDARIFRAARIVVDTSLHMGEMSFDEAVQFMMEKASLSEPTARAEVTRYCSWPTQAASYLTGSLEIERIRERYLAERRGDLRSFHDAAAGSGMLPIALLERAVLG